MSDQMKRDVRRAAMVLAGALLMALNLKIFVRAGGLLPGGVAGLSVLIQRLAQRYLSLEIPYTVVNVLLNAVPVYIGFRFIGKKFTILSLLMIVVSSVLTDVIPAPALTSDPLLIVVFGGLINGLAVSLCLLADATSGGTDFIAIYLSQKRGMETWNLVLAFNAVLLCISGAFFGWDKALYSIIFQYISTQVLHLMYRNYQQQTLFVVTVKAQEICDAIYQQCHHGATILPAEGAYERQKKEMVYSVISGQDAKKVIRTIREIDPEAFVNSIRTTELRGSFYMKPKD
ncbi:MAG: YitT family protein [Clostridia bacterium]|nr:YitT family protein [Clostridia bacterium]